MDTTAMQRITEQKSITNNQSINQNFTAMKQVKQPRKFSVLSSTDDRYKFVLPLDSFSNTYIQKHIVRTMHDMEALPFDAVYDYETRYTHTTEDSFKPMVRLAKATKGRIMVPQLYMHYGSGSKYRLQLNDAEIHISSSLFDLLVGEFGLKYYIDENRMQGGYKLKVILVTDDMISSDLTESLVQVGRLVKVTDENEIWGTDTLLGYHYSAWHPKIASTFTKYMDKTIGAVNFGFEAEKQDYDFRDRDNAIKLAFNTGFKKERDGSLGDGGFELISPVLPLNNDAVINEVLAPVRDILDAGTTDKCGGHINVSIVGQASKDILKKVKGSLPIFYSIYEKRLNNTYCGAQQFSTYLRSPRKYQSFFLKNNDILEFRIFPAIKNNTILKNRIDLMRIVFNELYGKTHNKVILEMATKNTKLYNFMLNVVCNGDMDKFKTKFKSFITLSAKYKCGIVTLNTIKKVEKLMNMSIITPVETEATGDAQETPTETRTFHVDLPATLSTWVTDAVTELSNDDSYRQERSNDGSISGVNEECTDRDVYFIQNVQHFRSMVQQLRNEFNTSWIFNSIQVNGETPTPLVLRNYIPIIDNPLAQVGTPMTFSRLHFRDMLRNVLSTNGVSIQSVLEHSASNTLSEIEHLVSVLIETAQRNESSYNCTYSETEMAMFMRIFSMFILSSRFTNTTNIIHRMTFKTPFVTDILFYCTFIRQDDGKYILSIAKRHDGNRFVYIYNQINNSVRIVTDASHNPFIN